MRKYFLTLLLALLPAALWAQGTIYTKSARLADFPQKTTKIVLSGQQLLDEVLARREDLAVLDAAGRKYGFSPAVFREEFRQGKDLQRVTNAAGCGIL